MQVRPARVRRRERRPLGPRRAGGKPARPARRRRGEPASQPSSERSPWEGPRHGHSFWNDSVTFLSNRRLPMIASYADGTRLHVGRAFSSGARELLSGGAGLRRKEGGGGERSPRRSRRPGPSSLRAPTALISSRPGIGWRMKNRSSSDGVEVDAAADAQEVAFFRERGLLRSGPGRCQDDDRGLSGQDLVEQERRDTATPGRGRASIDGQEARSANDGAAWRLQTSES